MRLGHFIIGLIVFVIVEIVSVNIGSFLGAGPAEAGIIVSAISVLCAIVIVCTLIIVETIENTSHNK